MNGQSLNASAPTAGTANQLNSNRNTVYIFDKDILLFLFILTVLGVVCLFFWPTNDESRICLFGFIVFVYSLGFPFVWSALPSHKVDFWYYSLAAIGVVLFFVAANNDRKLFHIDMNLMEATTNLERFLERRPVMEKSFVDSPRKIFESIKKASASVDVDNAQNTINGIKAEEWVAQCDKERWEILSRLETEHFKNEFRRPQRSTFDTERSIRRAEEQYWAKKDCSADAKKQIEEAKVNLRKIYILKNANHPKDLIEVLKSVPSDMAKTKLGLNMVSIPMSDFTNLLVKAWDSDSIQPILNEEEESLKKRIVGFNKTKDELKGEGKSDAMTALRLFIWPYIVLTALGLKLARRRYTFKASAAPFTL